MYAHTNVGLPALTQSLCMNRKNLTIVPSFDLVHFCEIIKNKEKKEALQK